MIKKTKTREKSSIKIAIYAFLTISVVNARIRSTMSSSPILKHLFGEDISSFCVRDKCIVVFPNGTSIFLPIDEFYNLTPEYLDKINSGFDIGKTVLEIFRTINPPSREIIEQNINSNLSNFPANEMNATEHMSNVRNYEINNASDNLNDTELYDSVTFLKEKNLMSSSTEQKHEIRSRSILSISLQNDTTNLSISTNGSSSECLAPDPHRIPDGDPTYLRSEMDGSVADTQRTSTKPSTVKNSQSEMDNDYSDYKESKRQKLRIKLTQEDLEKAKKMTKCLKLRMRNGIVCVCNETYCDKFLQPDVTPEWTYSWYTSSKCGHRFRKAINKLTPYEGDEDEAFYVNTNKRYQEIMGFGATFTDSACKLIQNLSKGTKKNLLESYFGPFGINYRLGRVPIGGTDFSPKFYSYIDNFDKSMKTFMLTEQDFKYKIPVILKATELTDNQMKLIGTAWSSPLWMKNIPTEFAGNIYRKYFPQWAEYHIKFLDQYLHNGVKFWAITTGKEPMNYCYIPNQPQLNGMEWTPYEQSYWVGSHLSPSLKNSSHGDVLLLGFDENREFINSYMKYFSEDYRIEYFDDPSYIPGSNVMNAIAGIAFHGYMDYKSNLQYLNRAKDMFPDKFFLYTETSCLELGMPEFGSWACGEIYATKIIQALNNWAVGWMDYNIALNQFGGPTYIHNHSLHSPIVVDVKRDEFHKEPMFYIMGHFSIFLLPGSKRVETVAPKGMEGIHAVAVILPDDGIVIVFYNQLETDRQATFIIDKKYKFSIEVPGKSINSVIFW